ncbi:toll/interleukin-1 receptor domain-containing protein [Inquilinus sp. YAF38]|uniref:toll/interleukin-1 receptor domain-containing protein n=1 Tax=Inquilinus sp. YAF38 TaxID=3233084 RepID=UPI003F8F8DFE
MATKAFISYSHADEKALERLHKHMAMLRREGDISTWTDNQVLAGDSVDTEISKNLEDSGIFIALLSPDYLASNYCYEKEFARAQELCLAGSMRIVPVVIEPCDWSSSPFREYLALPKDGKAISEWTNQNNAYLDVVSGIRRLIKNERPASTPQTSYQIPGFTSRNPKIKRDFDSIQKGDFADSAFAAILDYFAKSCAELNGIGDGSLKAKFEKMSDAAFTSTVVNRDKRSGSEAHITVRNSKRRTHHFGDINFIFTRYADDGSSNGSIRVEADDYKMYLVMDDFMTRDSEKFTPEQIAEQLWIKFVERAGVEYE